VKTHRLFNLFVSFVVLSGMVLTPFASAAAQRLAPPPEGDSPPVTESPAGESEVPLLVVRVYFDDAEQVSEIAAHFDIWEVNRKAGYLVIDLTPAKYEVLRQEGYHLEIDRALTEEINRPRTSLPGQVSGIPGYACYRTVEETYQSAADIAANHPDLADWVDIGDSWEKTAPGGNAGYDMMVLRLTNKNSTADKAHLFIMSAMHAREYTPAELNTRFAEYLIDNYGTDPDVTWLLDYTVIHLLLQANPDGRKHAEAGQSWRKNTNENYCGATSNYRGADLNRNYPFEWGAHGGSSGNECDTTYRGPSPASEPETQAVTNYVRSIFPDQRDDDFSDAAPDDATGIFLDIHSYSQLVLWPWGFTSNPTANGTALQTLGRKFAYFNGYHPEQAMSLYATDGTTDDFAYGELGLAAYTFELGTAFFQDCATFENTILPDNLPALVYAAKATRTPYLTPAGPDALNVSASPAAIAVGDTFTLTATINDVRYNNSNGTEPTQNIAAAVYSIDAPPWISTTITHTMQAADGIFNAKTEDVTAAITNTAALTVGRHILYVQGQDANGNWGAVSAAFLYVLDPATAPVIQGYVREVVTNRPLTATVSANGIFHTQTDPATGFYRMQVISGTYELTASADGYGSESVSGLQVTDSQTVNQDFHLMPVCDVFNDDAESGVNGWTAQSPWAISSEASHSPSHAWSDSPGGNYGNNINILLTSPVMDLTDYASISLDFWQICNTEATYDFCYVEASPDGAAWTTLATYDGPHTQWQQVTLPANVLDNQSNARIRFRLTSDVSVTRDGWHLDDIRLTAASTQCLAYAAPIAGYQSSSPDFLGETTVFTNTSSGSDLSFAWNFGDGSPVLTSTTPMHTFAAVGTYTVVLTATNSLGSDVYSDTVEIIALQPPNASFQSSSPDLLGETTVFTNTSSGSNLSFTWNFGDGSPALTDTNPVHTFGAAGVYTVTLTASNALGSDVYSDTVEIVAPPVLIFLPLVER